jgi:hypothetical protein
VAAYHYSCTVHGVFATSLIHSGERMSARQCPHCGEQAETWIGPMVRATRSRSRREMNRYYRYWKRTAWFSEVLHGCLHSADRPVNGGAWIQRASGPKMPPVSDGLARSRRHRVAAIGLLVVGLLGASVLFRAGMAGSDNNGPAATAAAACVDAANAASEYDAGARSASSTRSVLSDAEGTLQAVTHQYVGYTEIVRSVRAVRDDVDAGLPTPSPNDMNYLSAVCGSPAGTPT